MQCILGTKQISTCNIEKVKTEKKVKVAQSCLTLCESMDCTVHETLQARRLEWVAFPFSRGFSQPRDQTQVSHIAGGFLTSWATREAHRCENWTIKKAEHRRMDAFKLWCWRKLLRVLWTASRSNQSIVKEINPEYSLEGLMLKLKLQYLGHLMWRVDSLEKVLMLGKNEGRRRRGQQRMRWLDGIMTQYAWVWANSRRQWRTGKPGMLQSMGLQRVGHDLATKQQQLDLNGMRQRNGARKTGKSGQEKMGKQMKRASF